MAGNHNSGGARRNAGRKPVEDPKKQLTIYVEGSHIERVGGEEVAREIAVNAVRQSRRRIRKNI